MSKKFFLDIARPDELKESIDVVGFNSTEEGFIFEEDFRIDEYVFKDKFVITDGATAMTEHMEGMCGLNIVGILGMEFLFKHKSIIDISSLSIIIDVDDREISPKGFKTKAKKILKAIKGLIR